MDTKNIKRKYLQIDLFGSSVELVCEDGTEYYFYLQEEELFNNCYVKSRKKRKKKWSDPHIIKDHLEKKATFKFSDENEFGFVLN